MRVRVRWSRCDGSIAGRRLRLTFVLRSTHSSQLNVGLFLFCFFLGGVPVPVSGLEMPVPGVTGSLTVAGAAFVSAIAASCHQVPRRRSACARAPHRGSRMLGWLSGAISPVGYGSETTAQRVWSECRTWSGYKRGWGEEGSCFQRHEGREAGIAIVAKPAPRWLEGGRARRGLRKDWGWSMLVSLCDVKS